MMTQNLFIINNKTQQQEQQKTLNFPEFSLSPTTKNNFSTDEKKNFQNFEKFAENFLPTGFSTSAIVEEQQQMQQNLSIFSRRSSMDLDNVMMLGVKQPSFNFNPQQKFEVKQEQQQNIFEQELIQNNLLQQQQDSSSSNTNEDFLLELDIEDNFNQNNSSTPFQPDFGEFAEAPFFENNKQQQQESDININVVKNLQQQQQSQQPFTFTIPQQQQEQQQPKINFQEQKQSQLYQKEGIFKVQSKKIKKTKESQENSKNYDKNICRYLTRKTIRCFQKIEYQEMVLKFANYDYELYYDATEFFVRRIEQITGFRVLKEFLDISGETDPEVRRYKQVFKAFYIWFLRERISRYIMKGEMDNKLMYIQYKNKVMLRYAESLDDWNSNKKNSKLTNKQ